MAEPIREIQLKRTRKGQYDESLANTILSYGEPVVNVDKGYLVFGDGTNTYSELQPFIALGVPIPKLASTTFPYIKAAITPVITSYFPDYCSLSGQLSATAIGTYTITAKLLSDENGDPVVKWQDGTTEDKVLTWSITKYIQGVAQRAEVADQAVTLQAQPYIDGIKFNGQSDIHHYGLCETASNIMAKTVQLEGDFALKMGASLHIKFLNEQTSGNPTLNVNGTGAKNLLLPNGNSFNTWQAQELVDLIYDGKNYIIDGAARATETFAGIVKINNNPTSNSKQDAATPYIVNLKCRCYVQSTVPVGSINRGDLYIDERTGAMYYYQDGWKPVHNVWA